MVIKIASRHGTLLERNVEQMLKLIGIKSRCNVIINGYETDVFFQYNKQKIGIECKQREKSSISIRNLIHEWNSKNTEIKLDKIILIIFGYDMTEQDFNLAKKFGITIWDESLFTEMYQEAINNKENAKEVILKRLGIKLLDYKYAEEDELEEMLFEKIITSHQSNFFNQEICAENYNKKILWTFYPFQLRFPLCEKLTSKDKIKISLGLMENPLPKEINELSKLGFKESPETYPKPMCWHYFEIRDNLYIDINCGNDVKIAVKTILTIFRKIWKISGKIYTENNTTEEKSGWKLIKS